MATLHVKAGVTGIEWGVAAEEGSLITHKVSINRTTKKKDLRGRQGGFKCVTSYSKRVEATIEGAIPSAGFAGIGFTLGATHELDALNDPFALGVTLYVQSVTLNEKAEDYQTATVKMVGNENMG